jgi:hypothetical protein
MAWREREGGRISMVYFRMDPAAISGTFETSDTAGPDARFGHVEQTAAIFDMARANDLAYALKSMNEEDPTPPNLVQLSPGLTVNRGDPADDQRRIRAAADRNMIALLQQGWVISENGTPVAPPRNDANNWRHMAQSLGPAVVVDHEPTGHAG